MSESQFDNLFNFLKEEIGARRQSRRINPQKSSYYQERREYGAEDKHEFKNRIGQKDRSQESKAIVDASGRTRAITLTTTSSSDLTQRTVRFCSEKIAKSEAKLNGKRARAVLDGGASVSIVNTKPVDPSKIFQGSKVKVFDWRNEYSALDQWTKVTLELDSFKGEVECLVLDKTFYDLLISRPLTRRMKSNLLFDDSVNFGSPDTQREQVMRYDWNWI